MKERTALLISSVFLGCLLIVILMVMILKDENDTIKIAERDKELLHEEVRVLERKVDSLQAIEIIQNWGLNESKNK